MITLFLVHIWCACKYFLMQISAHCHGMTYWAAGWQSHLWEESAEAGFGSGDEKKMMEEVFSIRESSSFVCLHAWWRIIKYWCSCCPLPTPTLSTQKQILCVCNVGKVIQEEIWIKHLLFWDLMWLKSNLHFIHAKLLSVFTHLSK